MIRNSERFLGAMVLAGLLAFIVGCGGGDTPSGDESMVEQLTGPAVAQTGPNGLVRVIISLQSRAGNSDKAMVANAGGRARHMFRHVNGMSADVPEQAIEALRRNPRVLAVERAAILHTQEEEQKQELPWGVARIDDRIDGNFLPPDSNRGAGVLVAIIDSGIDYTHPDLAANYDAEPGWDFVNDDADPQDDRGHGTHCAGIVAAVDNDFGVVGVAPDATLCAYKTLAADGSGYEDDLIAALGKCVDDGVQVASISSGASRASSLLEPACNAAYEAGILLVAAAGNSGRTSTRFDNVLYPAKCENVIAVGATEFYDSRPSFSSTGPALELCAPGSYIYSTYLQGAGNDTGNDGDYSTVSGTSMACPHVAGSAALAIASGVTDVAAVRALLVETADDLGPVGRDVEYGWGMVDADEAAGEGVAPNVAPTVTITSPADGATFDSGATVTFAASASDLEDDDLSADIVWTSSIDQEIGTGGAFAIVLSDGTHTISAEVTDAGGLTDTDTITVTVGSGSGGGELVVAVSTDKASYSTGDTASITVTVTDGVTGIAGAAVSMRLTTPKGKVYTRSGTTGPDGTVVFTHSIFTRRDGSGTYTVDATASAPDYEDGSGSATFQAS